MQLRYPGLQNKRVLVIGATGFIGGRLVEKLVLEGGAKVRVLCRSFIRLPRVARFHIEIFRGDVTDADAVNQACEGCDIVFDCAYVAESDLQATRNVLEAAIRHRVGRVIHLSSLMAYGATADGPLTEEAPRKALADIYSEGKLASEQLALDYAEQRGLPVVVLQPAGIYGPFSDGYGSKLLEVMKRKRVILVNGGDGLFNSIYIDDAIDAMLLASVRPEAIGECYLISSEALTWREFYSRFETMLGQTATVSMTMTEATEYYRRSRERRRSEMRTKQFKRMARAALPEGLKRTLKRGGDKLRTSGGGGPNPVQALPAWALPFYASKTTVVIDKARRDLGFQPSWSFEKGMVCTERWARWANLVPGGTSAV